jgi:type IV conjugative transfer system coupling protein TraD
MSIFRNDTLGSWTRGGQAIVHNVRMSTQVFFQTGLACLILWVMGTVWYVLERSTTFERFVLVKLAEAAIKVDAAGGTNDPVRFHTPGGRPYWTSADWLIASSLAKRVLHRFEIYLIHGAILAGVFALVALGCAWFTFTRTGRGLGSNEYLRGARFGTVREVRRALRFRRKGPLSIGGIEIPAAFEPEHILISGAPGTGKTNIINHMLVGIRRAGRRAIVYDTAGTFVQKFYRPGIDILLNPLDARTDHWSPWVDVPRDYHYDLIAESTIPDKAGDPFWVKAPRGALAAVMRKLARQEHMLVSALVDQIMRSDLAELTAFAKGTDAAPFVSKEGERTSAGVHAELASAMRSFSYLDDTSDGFSIRKWAENEKGDGWLFISVKDDQLPTLRPLISVWLDIAVGAIMSIKPDQDRRIYCVIDELPSLHKLPSLSRFLARGRKYGGCGILGFQSYPQLEATYGEKDAAAITGNCSTWVALRANDAKTAKHVSENLGQIEQVEANEGMSYGVNDMRDGVNLSRTQVVRPLVLGIEVTNLPNLVGFLRFGRNLPVIRFTDTFRQLHSIAPDYVDRTTPPHRETSGQITPQSDRAGRGGQGRRRPADDPADRPPVQGEMFDVAHPAESRLAAPEPSGQDRPADDPASGKGAFASVQMLAPAPGSVRIELDYHDRSDGPRRRAKPA